MYNEYFEILMNFSDLYSVIESNLEIGKANIDSSVIMANPVQR